jgi:hypothetical protein
MRHLYVDWNGVADELALTTTATLDELAGLDVGDKVAAGDGELDVPAVVTAIDGTRVSLRIPPWTSDVADASGTDPAPLGEAPDDTTAPHPPVDVISVRVLSGTVLELGFDDGTTRARDVGPLLWGPVFQPMRDDPQAFARVAIDAESGAIVWPNGADISPELLRYDDLWHVGPAGQPADGREELVEPAVGSESGRCACRTRHDSRITRTAVNGRDVTVPAEECELCGTKWLREADAVQLDVLLGRQPRIDVWVDFDDTGAGVRVAAPLPSGSTFEVGNVVVVGTPGRTTRALVVEVDEVAGVLYFDRLNDPPDVGVEP